jgi:hypothetical protein
VSAVAITTTYRTSQDFLSRAVNFSGKVPFSKNGRTLAIGSQLFPILKLGTRRRRFNKCNCERLKEFWGERRDLNPRPSVPQGNSQNAGRVFSRG